VLDSPFVRYRAPQLLYRQFSPLFTAPFLLKDIDLEDIDLASTWRAKEARRSPSACPTKWRRTRTTRSSARTKGACASAARQL
jgi:hypothetical protein